MDIAKPRCVFRSHSKRVRNKLSRRENALSEVTHFWWNDFREYCFTNLCKRIFCLSAMRWNSFIENIHGRSEVYFHHPKHAPLRNGIRNRNVLKTTQKVIKLIDATNFHITSIHALHTQLYILYCSHRFPHLRYFSALYSIVHSHLGQSNCFNIA